MKQNEKFLVYAVTGFLVVILAVAILFGDDVPRRLPGGLPETTDLAKAPPSLEEVLNQRATAEGGAPAADASGTPGAGKAGDGVLGTESDVNAADSSPASGVGDQPLVANVQLLPPTPAALVTEKLGLSRRENDFRVVRARQGDSLGGLVQTWCGSTDYLEQARGLNEELTTLKVGQEVVLPWVEDEMLLLALESRKPKTPDAGSAAVPLSLLRPGGSGVSPVIDAAASAPAGGSSTPLSGSALRKYKVKSGDSLWKIAEREVGKKLATRFLDQVKELNPGLDADRIREGQELLLPPKG